MRFAGAIHADYQHSAQKHLERVVRKRFNRVRDSRRWHNTRKVKDYVQYCRLIADRAQATVAQLEQCDGPPILAVLMHCGSIILEIMPGVSWITRRASVAERRIDCAAKRTRVFGVRGRTPALDLQGQGRRGGGVGGAGTALFWISYSQPIHNGFAVNGILHKILWQLFRRCGCGGADGRGDAGAIFGNFRMCSFDRGFHSPNNRIGDWTRCWIVNALPQKGYLSKADQLREQEPGWLAARRQHPAVESAINNLEHRGLERVRSHGADGFERTVALSVLAANLHRIGLLLQRRERERMRRQKKVRLRAA